jgi:hypothetical protein
VPAVDLAVRRLLTELLLEVRVPVVLDLVVRPARQLRRDHGPPGEITQRLSNVSIRPASCRVTCVDPVLHLL